MEYLDLKRKLKKMRISFVNLSHVLQITPTGISRWKSRGIPIYGEIIIDLLERLPVEEREKFLTERLGEEF
jgi:hypothetical protein